MTYALGKGTIGPQPFDVTDGFVVRIEEESVSPMHDQLAIAPAAACDHRQCASHRLDDNPTRGLAPYRVRAVDESVERLQETGRWDGAGGQQFDRRIAAEAFT